MVGSPGGGRRTRRLLSKLGVAPKNPEHYTAVLSSSTRDIRKTRRSAQPSGFRPIESHDNGYRIDVSNDRSMIQVVPIEGDHYPGSGEFKSPQRNRLQPRVSPVVYSEPRSSPSITSATGLLDARDSQRRKMKSRLPPPPRTKTSRPQKNAQSGGQSRNPVSNARNKLKKALHLETGDGEQRQRSRQISDRPANSNRVRWDMSSGGHSSQTMPAGADFSTSFPILSSHRFGSFSEEKKETEQINSYEDLLKQRVHDIQERQKQIMHSIAEKDTIKGTLVTAIDGNLERNRKQISALDEELKEIEWHLSLDAKKEQTRQSLRLSPQPMNGNSRSDSADVEARQRPQSQTPAQQSNRVPMVKNDTEVQHHSRVPSPAYDMESVTSVGDPSITVDTDSVAAVFRSKHKAEERVLVTGLDPPSVGSARRSPMTVPRYFEHRATNKAKEPAAPRISAVVRGEEAMRYGTVVLNQLNEELRLDPVKESPNRGHEMQQDRAPSSSQRVSLRPPPRHPWRRRSRNAPPQTNSTRQAHDRSIHFSDSEELVFESQSSVDTRRNNNDNEIMNAMMPPRGDSSSWQEEHFDVDKFDSETGSLLSSEHRDVYRYSDRDQHLAVTAHYSREAHHHRQRLQSRMPTFSSEANRKQAVVRNGGVSSDSVETDQDLSFIRAVAAVVIQTAARRYLAELEADDRRYAVQVIQSAIWNWMYPIGNGYFDAEYDEFSGDRYDEYGNYYNEDERRFVDRDSARGATYIQDSEYDATGGRHARQAPQQHYRSIYYAPDDTSQRSNKRVTFVDDYDDLDEFASTEIQRVFRGWWARDTIEVNHYAATTIQRVFRGFWLRDSLEVDRYCATEIQRVVRGWLQRRSYIYDLYCIIVVQSVSRRYLAFYESAVRLANILYIQAIYRGYRVRSDLRQYGVDFCIHHHSSSSKLSQHAPQPSARRLVPHHSSTRYQNVPQPIARRPAPQRILYSEEEVLASAILIQAIFRGFRVRDELYRFVRNGQDIAATIIQTCWRRYDAEMNFINHLADVLIVQSIARRWLVRKKLERKGIVLVVATGVAPPSQNLPSHLGYTKRFNQKKNSSTHDEWKQHRLKVLERSASLNSRTTRSPLEGFENFDKDSLASDEWYCENKSQASDLLQSWKSR